MRQFTLTNPSGDRLTILEHGARMQSWAVRLGNTQRELILGYSDAQRYLQDNAYLGAVVGPYANRIGNGRLQLAQKHYQLQLNEGRHHLHGGANGLQRMQWQCLQHSSSSVKLGCTLADGHSGYPGPTEFSVLYQLNADSSLDVTLEAKSAQLTLAGPTLHPYFNLSGKAEPINQHQLWLNAELYTPTNKDKIPTGELLPVDETALDFRHCKTIGTLQLDHNLVVSANIQHTAAILTSPDQQLRLLVSSDYPGLQVYSGDYLAAPFTARQGICLEPQFYPDAPNHSQFPLRLTGPEQPFVAHIRYQVEKS
ncbi:aldose epimerase family protein [Rheinheimera sp.]|uniref:aldose epimerase family protein n=1 Tax=Rheinheimera sp. TaxID=1869214 RepID=UPI00273433B5|nr:aldose epimerase family protein [Rheinheimera sp.]MDP2716897.1 aldose epimerase family protein [Rheinheimera sp.]